MTTTARKTSAMVLPWADEDSRSPSTDSRGPQLTRSTTNIGAATSRRRFTRSRGGRPPNRPPSNYPTHTQRRADRQDPQSVSAMPQSSQQSLQGRGEPAVAELPATGSQPLLGRRYHLDTDHSGLAIPGDVVPRRAPCDLDRALQPSCLRLVADNWVDAALAIKAPNWTHSHSQSEPEQQLIQADQGIQYRTAE